ncbi:MAG TPA: hypothetical protein DC034_07805 [Clostridium sp.]|nr:hypothetical protein [Clostridium sp.]
MDFTKKNKKDINFTSITQEDLSWEDLKLILDNSFDEIYVLNSSGIIIYVNNVSTLHYGSLADELIGKSYQYLQEKQYCTPPVLPIVMKEKKIITMEQKTKTGRTITVTATPVFDEIGEIRMIVMNSRDISSILALKNKLELNMINQAKYKDAMVHHQIGKKYNDITLQSKAMQMCYSLGKRVSRFDCGVLILGDSGVGKNFFARYIHNQSNRKDEPFITINCATIPKELLESELFGYVKGAFSGADSKGKQGLAFVANKGTLFLDEIGEMPYNVQAKILQLVQDHSFIPLGGTKEVTVDIKLIVATNQNLEELMEKGQFRKDLYYRLDTIKITIPPLRERIEDIIPLVKKFLNKYNKKHKTQMVLSDDAIDALLHYSWPGNVRELEHLIERLILINEKNVLDVLDLPSEILNKRTQEKKYPTSNQISLHIPTKEEEKQQIIENYIILKSTYKVAEKLNISQSKVARIVKSYRNAKTVESDVSIK